MRNWDEIEQALPRIPETIVVTGPVCSGKTTLVELLAGYHEGRGRKVRVINRLGRYNELEVRTELGTEGVLIFDCPPPESVTRDPRVRYINCGLIL